MVRLIGARVLRAEFLLLRQPGKVGQCVEKEPQEVPAQAPVLPELPL